MIRNSWLICIMFFYVFFCNIIILCCFIILLHLISLFLLTRSLLVPYVYVSMESVDCILLSSFELKAILLTSSVKILCFSLLNMCCLFNISLFFYEFFLIFFKTIHINFVFFLDGLFYFRVELLLDYNFQT